jgi:GxxExxY protein
VLKGEIFLEMEPDFPKIFDPIPIQLDRIGKEIVDSAYRVHSEMGPGLLESVYEECMIYDMRGKGLLVENQVEIPLRFFENNLKSKLRLDLLVEKSIVVELKAVEKIHSLFEAQLLTYLNLSKRRLGYLINFNVPLIKNGIRRIVL